MVQLASILNLAALFCMAVAECDLAAGSKSAGQETETALCMNQGDGYYTFGMTVDLTSLGLQGTTSGGYSLRIMDNTCKILGVYNPPTCGTPAVIKENFLQYVLTVEAISADVGDPYFSFKYGNGKYSIGNNGCVCGKIGTSFNDARKGCRCAFPVAGQPTKRGIAFEA